MSQIDAQAARENLLPDNRSGASERSFHPSFPDCPPGRKNEISLSQRAAVAVQKKSVVLRKGWSGGWRDKRDAPSHNLARNVETAPAVKLRRPLFIRTRVTDLENNTKPQLLPHSPLPPLLKHHFVTNEAPNSESDSVSLGGRFLPSPPSIPPLSHFSTGRANLKIGM